MAIKAVVFDLFGTLVFNEDTKSYFRLFVDLGLKTSEEFRNAKRIALVEDFDNLGGFIKRIKPDAKMDIEYYVAEVKKEISSTRLYPETKNVLEELKKRDLKLGLISNLATPFKECFFNLGLNKYFSHVLFSCEIGLKKPDPRIYQIMIDRLAIDNSYILMVGDTLIADVDGPRSVGMQAVHLDRNNNSKDSINSLEEIIKYL